MLSGIKPSLSPQYDVYISTAFGHENGWAARSRWPTPAELDRGERFCDPCDHDPVGTDYVQTPDGRLESLTAAGGYTIRHIRPREFAL